MQQIYHTMYIYTLTSSNKITVAICKYYEQFYFAFMQIWKYIHGTWKRSHFIYTSISPQDVGANERCMHEWFVQSGQMRWLCVLLCIKWLIIQQRGCTVPVTEKAGRMFVNVKLYFSTCSWIRMMRRMTPLVESTKQSIQKCPFPHFVGSVQYVIAHI